MRIGCKICGCFSKEVNAFIFNNSYWDSEFAEVVCADEEGAGGGFCAFDGDVDGFLAVGDGDVVHDDAFRDIGGDVENESTFWGGVIDFEGEGCVFACF